MANDYVLRCNTVAECISIVCMYDLLDYIVYYSCTYKYSNSIVLQMIM